MKTRGRGDIFRDQQKLREMLSLRAQGIGPSALAAKYHVDHSTIIYHAKNHGIDTQIKRGIKITDVSVRKLEMPELKQKVVVVKQTVTFVRYTDNGSPINPGMDYKDYLQACEDRRWKQLLEGGKHRNNGTK